MIDFKKQPKTTDDKEILKSLESIAFECSLHINHEVRYQYDQAVSSWINNFVGDLAYRKQRYLKHYLIKKNEYLNGKTVGSIPQADGADK